MSSLPTKTEQSLKEEYNNIPVHYCKQCLSLKIMRVSGLDDAVYCDECGSTDAGETSIETWEELFKKRHGFRFLESNYSQH